jgi:dehydrogenase/reductase SDR family protein 7B
MHFSNKSVWIVGASSGIGKSLAIELSKQKCHLILSSRKMSELEKVQQLINYSGSKCDLVTIDLSKPETIQKASEQIIQRSPDGLDYLFLNAGISQRSLVHLTPIKIDREIMEVNFFGNIAVCKYLLPHILSSQSKHIAVVSSIVGKFGFPLRSAYSASKHALHGFYETLRAENQEHGLKVSMVVPGRVKTNISMNALMSDGKEYGKMDKGQANAMSAEKAAQQILKGIKANKKEIYIGGKELWMVYLKRYFPFLFYKTLKSIEKQENGNN